MPAQAAEVVGAAVCDTQRASTPPLEPSAGHLEENCARHKVPSQEEHEDTDELPANTKEHPIPMQQLQLQQVFPVHVAGGAVVVDINGGAVVVVIVVVVIGFVGYTQMVTDDPAVKSQNVSVPPPLTQVILTQGARPEAMVCPARLWLTMPPPDSDIEIPPETNVPHATDAPFWTVPTSTV